FSAGGDFAIRADAGIDCGGERAPRRITYFNDRDRTAGGIGNVHVLIIRRERQTLRFGADGNLSEVRIDVGADDADGIVSWIDGPDEMVIKVDGNRTRIRCTIG